MNPMKTETKSEPIHARQAIVTRYYGPTNTKPSRIRASCDRGSLTISMPLEYSGADCHAVAVRALLEKFHTEDAPDGDFRYRSWPAFDRWVCGGMPQASKDAYVWVQLPAPDADSLARVRGALSALLLAVSAMRKPSDWLPGELQRRFAAAVESAKVALRTTEGGAK